MLCLYPQEEMWLCFMKELTFLQTKPFNDIIKMMKILIWNSYKQSTVAIQQAKVFWNKKGEKNAISSS